MSILKDHLSKLKGKRVIVVMCDSMAYFGCLQDFDKEFLILDDVKEAEYKKSPVWKEPKIKFGSPASAAVTGDRNGLSGLVDGAAKDQNLSTVIVSIAHITRIWGEDLKE